MRLKQVLVEQQAWSQYLEVGIGPDAQPFTKGRPPLGAYRINYRGSGHTLTATG